LRIGRAELGQRSETVRRSNLSAIVRSLHERGPQSRSALVTATGLTRSAIRALVGELTTAGLAAEAAAGPQGTPGRPSTVVRLVPTGAVVLGMEILVDSMAAAIVGLGGEVLDQVRVDRPRGHLAPDEVVADLAALTGPMRRRAGDSLIGAGAAVAGVVHHPDGFVDVAPNLGWQAVPLAARLRHELRLSVPTVVANEADAGVLAEHRRGAAVGIDDVLFVSGEVGVGGGVLSGGLPLSGAAGYGGEIGHLPVNPGGAPCRCGSVGCWETVVGEGALLALAGLPPDAGRPGVDRVLAAAEAGSPAAIAALDHVGRWLGIGLGGLVNVLNPRLVVLGGIYGHLLPAVRPAVEAELERHSLRGPRGMVRVVPAALGADAPLIGAAELAFEPLLADPAAYFPDPGSAIHVASVSMPLAEQPVHPAAAAAGATKGPA
jgi:predicted NBD/HSP70 family sugar kinase